MSFQLPFYPQNNQPTYPQYNQPAVPTNDVGKFLAYAQAKDTDRNGFSKAELAKVALDQFIPSDVRQIAATIVAGGNGNVGYFNNIALIDSPVTGGTPTEITAADLVKFAAKSTTGNPYTIESGDFQETNSTIFAPNGVQITTAKLNEIAGTATPTVDNNQLMQLLMMLLGGGGFNPYGNNGYNPYVQQQPVNPLLALFGLGAPATTTPATTNTGSTDILSILASLLGGARV
jgi:hypothetical protein